MRITREGSKVARTRLKQKMIMEAADHATGGVRRRLPQEQQERHSNDAVGQEVTIDCILEQKESIMGAPDKKQSIRSLTRQLLQQDVSSGLSASSMSTTSSSQDDNVNDGRSKDSTTSSEEVSQNVDHLVTRRLQRNHPFLHKAVALRTASSSSVSSCASTSSSSFLQQGFRFFSSE